MKKIYEKANEKLSALARISRWTPPTLGEKLIHNLLIVPWYGCFLQRDAIKELIKYTRCHSD